MTAMRRPELLVRHAANYAALVKADLTAVGTSLAIRAAAGVVALVALLLALGLTGVAIMLGYIRGSFHWVLVIVPGVAWLMVLAGGLLAMKLSVKEKLHNLQDEVEADLQTLRLIKEMKDEQ